MTASVPGDERRQNADLRTLLANVADSATTLVAREIALLKAEIRAGVNQMAYGMACLAGAAVFLLTALIVFAGSAVDALAPVVESRALAGVIVGAVVLLIAAGLGLYAKSALSSASLSPKRTAESLARDKDMIVHRVLR